MKKLFETNIIFICLFYSKNNYKKSILNICNIHFLTWIVVILCGLACPGDPPNIAQ